MPNRISPEFRIGNGEDMTINVSITNGLLEQKLNKAITKMPESLRPRPFNLISAKKKVC